MYGIIFSKILGLVKKNKLVLIITAILIAIYVIYYLISGDPLFLSKNIVLEIEGEDGQGKNINDALIQEDVKNNKYIVIDISGAVKYPGIYKLEDGSRVGDAVKTAGGLLNESSIKYVSKNLNLAQKIEDGEKIYIPYEWDYIEERSLQVNELVIPAVVSLSNNSKDEEKTSGSSQGESQSTDDSNFTNVNINNASEEELDALPGIGPAYAKKIIDNRPYKDISELKEKSGLSENTINKITSNITF